MNGSIDRGGVAVTCTCTVNPEQSMSANENGFGTGTLYFHWRRSPKFTAAIADLYPASSFVGATYD